jgi:hypothetical protein
MTLEVIGAWESSDDWRYAYAPTNDPRVLAVIEQQQEDVEPPDYEATPPTVIGYDYGERANFSTIGGTSEVTDAWLRARQVNPYAYPDEEFADRFVRIFYGAEPIHLSSSVDRYTWAVVFNDPSWRERVGCPDDADENNLTSEVRSYLDGEVYAVGWAVREGRVMEDDAPINLDDYTVDIQVYGFYGEEFAKESAASFEHGEPTLSPLLELPA